MTKSRACPAACPFRADPRALDDGAPLEASPGRAVAAVTWGGAVAVDRAALGHAWRQASRRRNRT